ncbi:hypothetical protein Hanom_Chr02g00135151 [Helianthus anomalus]
MVNKILKDDHYKYGIDIQDLFIFTSHFTTPSSHSLLSLSAYLSATTTTTLQPPFIHFKLISKCKKVSCET